MTREEEIQKKIKDLSEQKDKDGGRNSARILQEMAKLVKELVEERSKKK